MRTKQSRVERILRARERVTVAREQLDKLDALDPRFAGALNEYSDALDERGATEDSR